MRYKKSLSYLLFTIYIIGFYYPISNNLEYIQIKNAEEQINPDKTIHKFVKNSHPIDNPDTSTLDLSFSSLQDEQLQYGEFNITIFDITAIVGGNLPFQEITSDPFVDYGILKAINISYVVYITLNKEIIDTIDGYLLFNENSSTLATRNEIVAIENKQIDFLSATHVQKMNIYYSVLKTYYYANRTINNAVGSNEITWNDQTPNLNIITNDVDYEMIVIWPNRSAIVLGYFLYLMIGIIIIFLYNKISPRYFKSEKKL